MTSPAKKLLLTKTLTDLQKHPMSSAMHEHVDTPVAEAPTVDQDHRQESPRYHRTHSFCSKIPRTPVLQFIVGNVTSEKLRAQLALKSSSSEKQNQKAKSSMRSTKDTEIPKSRKQ